MANESILELILRIKKQGKGVPEAGVELKGLDDIVGGLKKKVVDLAGPAGMAALAGVMIHSVKVAAEYGDNMGDLAQLTGATVEETSRLNTVMEIAGMKTDNLSTVIKSMTKSGLQLNIQTLRRLSAEYQAIQDPIAKNEFLFKKFGKAGADMAELMGKTSAELDELAAAADRSGKVINEGIAEEAENLNIRINELKASSDGLFIKWGNNLIPTADALAQAMQYLTRQESDFNDEILESWGVHLPQNIDATKAAWRESEHFAVAQGAVYTHAMMAADAINTSNTAAAASGPAFGAAITAGDGMANAMSGAATALKTLQDTQAAFVAGAGGDVVSALNAAGVEGDAYMRALAGADAVLGTSMAKDEEKKKKLDELTQQYADGKIGIDEYKAGLNLLYAKDLPETQAAFKATTDRAVELEEQLRRIDGLNVTTYLSTVYTTSGQNAGGSGANAGQQIGFADGGVFTVPPGYPNDSFQAGLTSGETVIVIPNVTMNNSFTGGQNPQEIANALAGQLTARVNTGLAARARAARNSGAAWQGRD